MKKTSLLMALLGMVSTATTQAQPAHQHGVGALNIAISKQELVIELHTPADNIVGFEFIPKTDQQKQTLSHAISLLKRPESLFKITKQAQCHLTQTQIDNPFEFESVAKKHDTLHDDDDDDDEYEHEHEHDSHDGDEHETHADFEIQYSYHCQQPEQLTGLKINGLFKRFPNFVTLNVQWVNDSQQSATTLAKEAATVSFNP